MRPWTAVLAVAVISFFGAAFAPARSPVLDPEPISPGIENPGKTTGDPANRRAADDTIWIADWEFGLSSCDPSGWTGADNRISYDDSNPWHRGREFDGTGEIAGQAAILSRHDDCWSIPDGYGNNWDYAIVCKYSGAGATLSFDYLLDSEVDYDSLIVEVDSLCSSNARVDYSLNPVGTPGVLRLDLFGDSGLNLAGSVDDLSLPDFGALNDIHCVYIRFHSDFGYSQEDGQQPTTLGAALVVDNVRITGGLPYSEDFEGPGQHPLVTLLNVAPSAPFGLWARLHPHVLEKDFCSGDARGCAWIFSDPRLPAMRPEMAFGPGGVVVRSWLDNIIISPWVSLPNDAGTVGTFVRARSFPGNTFDGSRIVQNWSVRTRAFAGGNGECISSWKRTHSWNSLGTFQWVERWFDLTPYIDPDAVAIQLRYRVSDWQYVVGSDPPAPYDPGPGPYLDRVQVGRRILRGPTLEAHIRSVASDNFASDLIRPGPVEDFKPSHDRLGTSDFTTCLTACSGSPRTGIWCNREDSLVIHVRDLRGAGGITGVFLNAAIVAGPHAGKSPAPWTVGSNGFFVAPADTARYGNGSPQENYWFVDLDDNYFRGGDVLLYFWSATDAAGGYASLPDGMSSPPGSVQEADIATDGLFEASFLPAIDWDEGFLARIQTDPHGRLEPTQAERDGSRQSNHILYTHLRADYDNRGDYPNRGNGPINRSHFMYVLDRLGYAGAYDVYDQPFWSDRLNNPLVSRASVEQATGYALIILDAPEYGYLSLPDGSSPYSDFTIVFEQSQWFQEWLARASTSEAGTATLWVIGTSLLHSYDPANHVLTREMGAVFSAPLDRDGLHPRIIGQTSFTWADGTTVDFAADRFVLDTRQCGVAAEFDGMDATGSAVVTHRYRDAGGPAAVVMNTDPAASWNTIVMSFQWNQLSNDDVMSASRTSQLVNTIVRGALPDSLERHPDPTTNAYDELAPSLPRQTQLHPCVPNPFNPTTTIRFDLGRDSYVELRIYDVAGRLVRTLVNGPLERNRHAIVWDGLADGGVPVSSGIYFYRLKAGDFVDSRKMVVLK